MTFDNIACWAKIKGLSLVASGDFTHPEWFFLTKEKLEPAGNGFFRLKNLLPPANGHLKAVPVRLDDVHFVLSTEISFIYSKKGKVRKVHLLILAPDFESVEKLNARLSGLGTCARTAGPSSAWTPGISSGSWPTSVRAASSFRPTSGRPGSRFLAQTRGSMPSRNASRR